MRGRSVTVPVAGNTARAIAILGIPLFGVAEIPDGHRWDSSPKIRFAVDSSLEGRGLEPSVPVRGLAFFGNRPLQSFRRGRQSLLGVCHSWSKHRSLVFA